MTLLTAVIGLVTIPLLVLPTTARRASIAITASLTLCVLIIDTFVFAQYRFHMNAVVVELVFSGDVVDFPLVTWLMSVVAVALLVAIEFWLITKLESKPAFMSKRLGRKFTYLTIIMALVCNGLHIWAAANAYQPISIVKQYLPLFQPATANSFMRKHGWLNEEAIAQQKSMALKGNSNLNYPLSPLTTHQVDKPVNIMFLVVDSWRFDTFNQDNAPNLWALAQQGESFENHVSTGNATRTGIFGMFYGLPGTYWHSFLANHKSPVFIDRLQQMDYQLGLFASAKLSSPEFDQTVFANVKNLRIRSEGNTSPERDINLTQDWKNWYDKRDPSKPVFSFLFYDAPHAYDFPEGYPHQYTPMLKNINYLELNNETDVKPFMNRYKTSVHFTDSLAKQVIDKLKETGDLKNTVLIITGDHAQELNDNKLNYWGHNSNFTPAQTKVPFIVVGPKVPKNIGQQWGDEFTSHEDIVPTLMSNYLGVDNKTDDYSTGVDIFAAVKDRPWVLVSSYSGYGIVSKDSILEVGATGQSHFMDTTNHLKEGSPNYQYVQQALEQISRFRK
ncbi:choline-sulfatase [Vibrio algivorus]|uniref:Choline-sulfatase n=2 Tax=Vibrio algivorus TaxID=1667024 RepID=A0ABQ6EJ51_9VIBR|nr:choline-sulfatase [Vibrio algivorus]